ncbi:hypothetical protein IFM89_005178 [Coptis chinensis]|uniref:GDP-mannose 4,6-dehydratase n=1 Tax=Coptis chinensis TaxID=261450 RepID=A0A835M9W4_9MAGN|nr:hypothetical protein IFM89_005178 [Coptis chinensis]
METTLIGGGGGSGLNSTVVVVVEYSGSGGGGNDGGGGSGGSGGGGSRWWLGVVTDGSRKSWFARKNYYAASKCAAHWYTVNYREAYGLFACNGILFNHESRRRGENFVTRKITRAVGRIKIGLQSKLFLGNLVASRDWGFAGDYAEAMWLMLQQEKPDDYVVATEESHSVEEFLEVAFGYVGLSWRDHVVIDKRFVRPAEVDNLKGDSSKARKVLRWKPKVGFEQLVKMWSWPRGRRHGPSEMKCSSSSRNLSLLLSILPTIAARLRVELVTKTVGKDDKLCSGSVSTMEEENGLTDDHSDSGLSNAILLHKASQLLMTSVSLPFNSPTSTCNG